MMAEACISGDIDKLKDFVRQGVRVSSARHLCLTALWGEIEIMCCLVKDLGADVNEAEDKIYTPLLLAVQERNVAAVRYWSFSLVQTLILGMKTEQRRCSVQLSGGT
jgi:uncharacterized protein involved in response to NO